MPMADTRCNTGDRTVTPVTSGALTTLRLGRRERNVLLRLDKWKWKHSPYASGLGLDELEGEEDYRDADRNEMCRRWKVRSSTNRRAVRKLAAAGLVNTWMEHAGPVMLPRHYLKAELTNTGRLVVDTYRDELENGKRIRWAKLGIQ